MIAFVCGFLAGAIAVYVFVLVALSRIKCRLLQEHEHTNEVRIYLNDGRFPVVVMSLTDIRAFDRMNGGKGDLIVKISSWI